MTSATLLPHRGLFEAPNPAPSSCDGFHRLRDGDAAGDRRMTWALHDELARLARLPSFLVLGDLCAEVFLEGLLAVARYDESRDAGDPWRYVRYRMSLEANRQRYRAYWHDDSTRAWLASAVVATVRGLEEELIEPTPEAICARLCSEARRRLGSRCADPLGWVRGEMGHEHVSLDLLTDAALRQPQADASRSWVCRVVEDCAAALVADGWDEPEAATAAAMTVEWAVDHGHAFDRAGLAALVRASTGCAAGRCRAAALVLLGPADGDAGGVVASSVGARSRVQV